MADATDLNRRDPNAPSTAPEPANDGSRQRELVNKRNEGTINPQETEELSRLENHNDASPKTKTQPVGK